MRYPIFFVLLLTACGGATPEAASPTPDVSPSTPSAGTSAAATPPTLTDAPAPAVAPTPTDASKRVGVLLLNDPWEPSTLQRCAAPARSARSASSVVQMLTLEDRAATTDSGAKPGGSWSNGALTSKLPQISALYADALRTTPGLEGVLIIEVAVDSAGHVAAIGSGHGTTLKSAALAKCVIAELADAKLAPPTAPQGYVQYALHFVPQQP